MANLREFTVQCFFCHYHFCTVHDLEHEIKVLMLLLTINRQQWQHQTSCSFSFVCSTAV